MLEREVYKMDARCEQNGTIHEWTFSFFFWFAEAQQYCGEYYFFAVRLMIFVPI